jgi:site-specific DNA recombinase
VALRPLWTNSVELQRVTIKADDGDLVLEETFLYRYGDDKVTRRMFVPGEDHSHELEQVKETIARLRRESDAGLIVSEDDEPVYLGRMRALIERRTKLEAVPYRAAGWITEETDQTDRDVWPTLTSDAERRQLLVDRGVRFVLTSGKPLEFHVMMP